MVSLPKTVKEIPLGDLHSSDITKILRSDDTFETLYRSGKIPAELLSDIHRVFGGVPRFIEQIVSLIGVDPEQFHRDLKAVTLPVTHDLNRLRKIRDDYYNSIVLDRLFALLSEGPRDALCRSAVYNVGVSPEGFTAVTGISQESIPGYLKEWQSRAFVYPEMIPGFGEIWIVYGILRPRLLNHLHEDEKIAACNSAGDFLYELVVNKRNNQIGILWIPCFFEARSLYLQANNVEKARNVTSTMSKFYIKLGMFDLIKTLNREILKKELHPEPMGWIGIADMYLRDYVSAKDLLNQVLDLNIQKENVVEIANSLHQLATLYLYMREYDDAKRLFIQAFILQQKIGNTAGIGAALHGLGNVCLNQSYFDSATTLFNEALEIRQKINDNSGIIATLHGLASTHLRKRQYDDSMRLFIQSLSIKPEIDDLTGRATTIHNIASIEMEQGDYDSATTHFNQALEIRQKIRDNPGTVETLHQLEKIAINKEDYDLATTHFSQELDLLKDLKDKVGMSVALHQLGSIALIQGDNDSAKIRLNQALDINIENEDMGGIANSLHQLGSIEMNQGEHESAKFLFNLVFTIRQDIGDEVGLAVVLHQLGDIDLRQEEYESAKRLFIQSLVQYDKLGSPGGISYELIYLGRLAHKIGLEMGAIKLIGLAYIICKSNGHPKTNEALSALQNITSSYSDEQVYEIIGEAVKKYQDEGAVALVESIFTEISSHAS